MALDELLGGIMASGVGKPRGGLETAIGHWAQLLEGLRASPQDFYSAVEAAIKRREIPDCRVSRVDWREGGLTSAKREYLRVERGEDLIDICGAPFGNAFFSSSWLCTPPPNILKAVAMTLGSLALLGFLTRFRPGPMVSLVWYLDILLLLCVGIFGVIRPLFFPPRLTYYRIDTAEMFYQSVHQAVLEVIDGMSTQQGLRLLSESERKPIMRGLGR